MLPDRRQKSRSGILRAPKREWPRHKKFVRSHGCCVPGCEGGPIEFAHLRSAANAGKSQKPFDWFGVSLCLVHHAEAHKHGHDTFARKYRVDLWALAREFAAKSPDLAMKEAMRNER